MSVRLGTRLALLPFKLAALLLLMVAPAQAALQQSNCSPAVSSYSDQADGDMPSLTPLRAVAVFANAAFQPDADTSLVPREPEIPAPIEKSLDLSKSVVFYPPAFRNGPRLLRENGRHPIKLEGLHPAQNLAPRPAKVEGHAGWGSGWTQNIRFGAQRAHIDGSFAFRPKSKRILKN